MPTFTPPGARPIPYDESGAGTPVILLHGLGLSREHWLAQRTALAAAGYHVVAYDQRGFGEAPVPPGPYAFGELVGDLRAVADHFGFGRFHLVGHSLGGMVSAQFAVEHPERLLSLTLISATGHNGKRASVFAEGLGRLSEVGYEAAAADPLLRRQIEEILAQGFPGATPPFEMFKRGFEHPHPASRHAWMVCSGFSVKDQVPALKLPALIMHGTHDTWIPFVCGQWLAENIAGARWHPLEKAGHFPQIKRADEVTRLLLDFFGSIATT